MNETDKNNLRLFREAAAALWPFIDSMNPAANVRALAAGQARDVLF